MRTNKDALCFVTSEPIPLTPSLSPGGEGEGEGEGAQIRENQMRLY
jgi:hypothetical protein